MNKEPYERIVLNITLFGTKDMIATSEEDPGTGGGGTQTVPEFVPDTYEIPVGF